MPAFIWEYLFLSHREVIQTEVEYNWWQIFHGSILIHQNSGANVQLVETPNYRVYMD